MQIEIYTGHFGSGKTEVVLNRALAYANQGETVHLVDLDIVKPYFRSREVRHLLQQAGIHLITPGGDLENADLPVMSPKVLGTLTSAQGKILFDVGGDSMGATALGAFAQLLVQKNYEMYLVLNPFRPFTKDRASVEKMRGEIEAASHLKMTGIISNPNLGQSTSLEDLVYGLSAVREMSEALEIPIVLTSITEKYADRLVSDKGPLLKLRNYLLPPWEQEEGQVFRIEPRCKRRDNHA